MPELAQALRSTPTGVRIAVRAQPRASRDALVGAVDDGHGGVALKVAVTAPPVEGEANDALVRFLAKSLGVSRRDVVLVTGDSGRSKTFEVRGLDLAATLARLSALR